MKKVKIIFYCTVFIIFQNQKLYAKTKTVQKNITTKNKEYFIDKSYFLQASLDDENCSKMINQGCFFRDKFLSDPYFHKTKIIIFDEKIIAKQFYDDKVKTIAIKNGSYKILTEEQNNISFNVINGFVEKLNLKKGNIKNEKSNISKCLKAEFLYNFYNSYNKENITISNGFYKNDYNFKGLEEYSLFYEKNNPAEIMMVKINNENEVSSIENINLCKMNESEIMNIRHVNQEECLNNSSKECIKYETCSDQIIVNNCEVTLFKNDN